MVRHILIATLLSFSPLSLANSNERDYLFSLSLEELLTIPIQSVSKTDQTLLNAPAAIHIIERRELQGLGILDLKQLLAYVPSIEYGYPHSWLQGGIRGFADNWSKVKLLVDGEEMNLLFTGEAFIGHQFSLHDIERVEVIPGPASVLYGADAYTGIVNLVTRSDKQSNFQLALQGGDRDFQQASASIYSSHHTDTSRLYFSGFYLTQQDGDFTDFVSSPDFSEPNRDLRTQLLNSGNYPYRDDNEAYKLEMGFSLALPNNQSITGSILNLYDRDGGGQESPEISFKDFYTERNQIKASVTHEIKSEDLQWSSKLNVRYRIDDEFNRFNFREPVNGQLSDLYHYDIENSRETQVNWDGDYRFDWHHVRVSAGLGYSDKRLTTPYFELDPFDNLTPFLDQQNWHLYTQYEQSLFNKDDRLILGARKDNNDIYDSPVVYRASYLYSINEKFNIKLLYGESFRAPTLFELELNDQLTPSLMNTHEATLIFIPKNNWLLQASLYKNDATDLIVNRQVTDDDQNTDLFIAFNEGHKTTHGSEWIANYYFPDGSWSMWLTHTDTDDGLDVAEYKAGLRLTQHLAHGWTLGLSGRYTSPIDTEYLDGNLNSQTLTVASYINFDLNLSYAPDGDKLRFALKLNNLLDRENNFPNVRGNDPKQFESLGRTLQLSLDWAL